MQTNTIYIMDVFIANHPIYYRIPIVAVLNRTVFLFANRRIHTHADCAEESHVVYRRLQSGDRGQENILGLFEADGWNTPIGTAIVDQGEGLVRLSYYRWRSAKSNSPAINHDQGYYIASTSDCGKTWEHIPEIVAKNKMNCRGHSHGASQAITIRKGDQKGRLVVPARFFTKLGEDINNLQRNHYNCALYSDDRGKTWQTGGPVQVGTGEGCLVELSDGRIYYNSRAYFLDGQRRIAWSYDGGETFSDYSIEKQLKEPLNGGCNAGIVLYPPELSDGKDIILFSNPDDEKRACMTVKASFDGGQTWRVSKVIHKGPSAYSSMAVGMDGTIYVLFENGEQHPYEKISLARFSLDWLKM